MTHHDFATDQRLLVGIYKIASQEVLPSSRQIRHAIRNHDLNAVANLVTRFVYEVEQEAILHTKDLRLDEPHITSTALTAFAQAADLAYPVRLAAQGLRGPAPSPQVWALLLNVLTLLLLRYALTDASKVSRLTTVVAEQLTRM